MVPLQMVFPESSKGNASKTIKSSKVVIENVSKIVVESSKPRTKDVDSEKPKSNPRLSSCMWQNL